MSKVKKRSGGFIIANDELVLLGKTNHDEPSYEGFGGKAEESDLSPLHTAIRELIEEMFNVKVSTELINYIACNLEPYVKKKINVYGDSFLLNYEGLNYIAITISKEIDLSKYIKKDTFLLEKYIAERIITDKPSNGLNEISSLKLIKIKELLEGKWPLRWHTNRVIQLLFKKDVSFIE